MFERYRDKIKCKKYWESIDGQYENRIKIKKHRLGVRYDFRDPTEVTLLIKWTFNARDSSGNWWGYYDLDFVGVEGTDEVFVKKDKIYDLMAFGSEQDVHHAIEEQIREGAIRFGVKDYEGTSKALLKDAKDSARYRVLGF